MALRVVLGEGEKEGILIPRSESCAGGGLEGSLISGSECVALGGGGGQEGIMINGSIRNAKC